MRPASAIANRTTLRRSRQRVGVVERRERRRLLDHAGNRGGLRKRDVADVLAEKQPRRFSDAKDRERPALAERDVVQIHLEDVVFRRAARQDDRHECFERLALHRAAPRFLQRNPSNFGRNTLRTSCWVIVLPPREIRTASGQRTKPRRQPRRSDRHPGARSSGGLRSPGRPRPAGAGIAVSATGRRFSRSPATIALSTGASSVEPIARRGAEQQSRDVVRQAHGRRRALPGRLHPPAAETTT